MEGNHAHTHTHTHHAQKHTHIHTYSSYALFLCSYYARVYMARLNGQGEPEGQEVDVDARPSDAINFAIRSGVGVCVHVCVCAFVCSVSACFVLVCVCVYARVLTYHGFLNYALKLTSKIATISRSRWTNKRLTSHPASSLPFDRRLICAPHK